MNQPTPEKQIKTPSEEIGIVVKRICEHCNNEYIVPLHWTGNAHADLICNFTVCPNCGVRDDVWIMVTPIRHHTQKETGLFESTPILGK